MTEGVERDIADDSNGGKGMDFWGFAAGWRWLEKTQRAKAPNRLRQALKDRDDGGEAGGSKT
jgi:hypothetical protein